MTSAVKSGVYRLQNGNQHQHTDEHMGRCDLVPFLCTIKANVPSLGPRFSIEVKCPHMPGVPVPLGLNIDTCLRKWVHLPYRLYSQGNLSVPASITVTPCCSRGRYSRKTQHICPRTGYLGKCLYQGLAFLPVILLVVNRTPHWLMSLEK